MKRFLSILLLFLLCTGIIFAAPGKEQAAKEITFWSMPNAPDDVQMPWVEKKAAEFEKATGIKVLFEVVGWGDAWPKISSAIATGEGVDVFQVGTTWNPQFAATGGLEELNIADFGGSNAYMKANLESCTYKGKVFGIPWFAETRVLYINKDMFAEAGVKAPKTHEELMMVGKKIIDVFGQGRAISIAGTNAWDLLHNFAIILWANGGDIVKGGKAVFNGPEGVRAMRWYVGLLKEGLASKANAEYNQPQADAAFINGNVAMCYMGPWNIANINHDNPELNYDVVEPPAGPAGFASFSGGSNLVVLKRSKNLEAAKAWIKHLVKTQNIVEYTKDLTNMLPAKIEAFDDPFYDKGVWKTFKKVLSYATAYPPLGVWGDIENSVVQDFKNVLADYVNGTYTDASAQQYLNAAASKVNAALAKEM